MTASIVVRITSKNMLTPGVCRLTLEPVGDAALPTFDAGAHINVETAGGATRSYSLNDPPRPGVTPVSYTIAVRRSADGRGGSISLVDDTDIGDLLRVSEPRNTFPLLPAARYLLIAGGIGITPIRAMLHSLLEAGVRDVHLIYLTRSIDDTPYLAELSDPNIADHVTIYHRADHDGAAFDLWPHLADPGAGTMGDSFPMAGLRRVFCCGPESLQQSVRALTMHWRPSVVHFENFAGVSAFGALTSPFTAIWQPTGHTVAVGERETLLDALRREHISVPSSCESGTCGTCRIRLVSGPALHRDAVLDEAEHGEYIIPCVSRGDGDIAIAPL